ncbi:MAG: hypothetical protein ACTSX0_04855, partial [Promethearchaeota archaeon]
MKLKRNEFTTSFVVLALFAVTAALTLLSAYGAVCVTWDPKYSEPPFSMAFAYVMENLVVFRIANIITWLGALFWGYVIFAFLTQRKGAYIMALLTAIVSFAAGLVPALISDLSKVNEETPFSIGSPHWARTFANLLVIIVLLIPPVRRSVVKFASTENRFTGNVAKQLMMMSLFFFWLSMISFLGTNFMASAHVISGFNYWQLVEIQSLGAYT